MPDSSAKKKKLKILFVSSEASPFAVVGGLGRVNYSLPEALCRLGHDARVLIPKYLSIDDSKYNLKTERSGLLVPTGNKEGKKELICNVKRSDPGKGCRITNYFLENREYYEQRANIYGYADDTIRWGLLCRGAIEFLRTNNKWLPDLIVCADWQAALIPNYLKTVYVGDKRLARIATVLSIHNLSYQALFDHHFVAEMDEDNGRSPIPGFNDKAMAKINWMKRGILFADAINTVSRNYAQEILTKEYGENLDNLLRERRTVLTGILNGIDYELWDPENCPHIPHKYSAGKISERKKNKEALQKRFNLRSGQAPFLISIVGRLSKQKGLNLLKPILEFMLRELPLQLIVLGEGESELMSFFQKIEVKFPDKVATHLKFDDYLPFLIFAGADAVLLPSRFEPCGLVQLEAMRMGAIPIVRQTGGLADSVDNFQPEKDKGTGFVFKSFDSNSLLITIVRALENFRDRDKWERLQVRAMVRDFSWTASAKNYVELFTQAIANKVNSK
jgi:starch synthase